MRRQPSANPRYLYVFHAPRLLWIAPEGSICSVVKIGCSKDPSARRREIQYRQAAKLEIIRLYGPYKGPVAFSLERPLHNSLKKTPFRMDGAREWYGVPNLAEFLKELDSYVDEVFKCWAGA